MFARRPAVDAESACAPRTPCSFAGHRSRRVPLVARSCAVRRVLIEAARARTSASHEPAAHSHEVGQVRDLGAQTDALLLVSMWPDWASLSRSRAAGALSDGLPHDFVQSRATLDARAPRDIASEPAIRLVEQSPSKDACACSASRRSPAHRQQTSSIGWQRISQNLAGSAILRSLVRRNCIFLP